MPNTMSYMLPQSADENGFVNICRVLQENKILEMNLMPRTGYVSLDSCECIS